MHAFRPPKLSICIATFNRAAYIGATLNSIVNQVTSSCEIVVLDGGSSDNTAEVVAEYARRFSGLRYIRQEPHTGLDHAVDEVVKLARGDYCWLPTSKDLLKPGAVSAVLNRIADDVSLIAVNMEIRDINLSKLLVPRSVTFENDVVYNPEDLDRLFREAFYIVSHLSCLVIKRTIWLSRERRRYYGSLATHLAVIFQQPLPGKAIAISSPLVCHRFGSQSWLGGATQLELMWTPLLKSLALPESTKKMYDRSSALKRFNSLLRYRACGFYSWAEYRRFIRPTLTSVRHSLLPALVAFVPGSLLNAILVLQTRASSDHYKNVTLQMLRASRFHVKNWARVASDG